jgi:hypothetical protein
LENSSLRQEPDRGGEAGGVSPILLSARNQGVKTEEGRNQTSETLYVGGWRQWRGSLVLLAEDSGGARSTRRRPVTRSDHVLALPSLAFPARAGGRVLAQVAPSGWLLIGL